MLHDGSDINAYFQKYKTKKYNFEFPAMGKISIETILEIDTIIDEISDDEFNTDERLPYWAEIWPSAIGLSSFLAESSELGKLKILELGAGLGLAGIVAGKKNATVTFSDYEDISLQFCEHNAKLNNITNFNLLLLDWRSADLKHDFDYIIAADVIYEKRFMEPILNLISSYLKPNGKAILAEPGRKIANEFFTMIKAKNIAHKQYTRKIDFNNRTHDIDIHILN